MPTRPTIVLILLGWALAAAGLLRRDILPDLWTTPPPDLRSIARAEQDDAPTEWDLSVADDDALRNLRPVGRAVTETRRSADGDTILRSKVNFDSIGLLRGTPFDPKLGDDHREGHIEVHNTCAIDASGNLRRLDVAVRPRGEAAPIMTIDAHPVGRKIEVTTRTPYPWLNASRTFDYEPRHLIRSGVGPIDRLPGLQVGQRWDTEVLSPLTGRVEPVRTEVTGKHSIQWNNKLVPTLEVVQHLSPIKARSWVGLDGLVLRQEIPLGIVRLILDRVPPKTRDDAAGGTATP